jgi:hypothetical protein
MRRTLVLALLLGTSAVLVQASARKLLQDGVADVAELAEVSFAPGPQVFRNACGQRPRGSPHTVGKPT